MALKQQGDLSDVVAEIVDPFGGDHRRSVHTLLPDPDPGPVRFPLVSVDDHFVEPGDIFTSRLASRRAEEVPWGIEEDGVEDWNLQGNLHSNRSIQTSAVGRPNEESARQPVRFDEM